MVERRRTRKAQADLIADISAKSGVARPKVLSVLQAWQETMCESLEEGMLVTVLNFGNFRLAEKPSRPSRNPKTGETFQAPAGYRVQFRAGEALKGLCKGLRPGSVQDARPKRGRRSRVAVPEEEADIGKSETGEEAELRSILEDLE